MFELHNLAVTAVVLTWFCGPAPARRSRIQARRGAERSGAQRREAARRFSGNGGVGCSSLELTRREPFPSYQEWTHLTRDTPVVGASLPKPTAEAFNVADSLVFIRKIHLPDQRAVSKNPHGCAVGTTSLEVIKELK